MATISNQVNQKPPNAKLNHYKQNCNIGNASTCNPKGQASLQPIKKVLIIKLNNPGTSSTDIIIIYSKCRSWSRHSHILWSLTTKPNALRFPCCAHLEECCEVDLHPTERSRISCKRNENTWAQAAPRKRSCQLGFWWTVLHMLRRDWTPILLHPYSDSEIDSHLLTGRHNSWANPTVSKSLWSWECLQEGCHTLEDVA